MNLIGDAIAIPNTKENANEDGDRQREKELQATGERERLVGGHPSRFPSLCVT